MMLLGEKSMAAQLANYQKHGMTRFPVKVMPNCGHFLSLDDSKLLAQIVDQFVHA
jgi:pimeloyl-ACP methyl ester carboxylesterase